MTELTPYDVTDWRADSRVCDWCSEGWEYGVHRHAFYVSRDGASARTADDLCNAFQFDVLDIMAGHGLDDDNPTYWTLRARADDWSRLLDARRDPMSGCAWLEPDDGEIGDDVDEFEEQLGDLGYVVTWDDGYAIERVEESDDVETVVGAWREYLERDGGSVPCSRYGRTSVDCAPYAIACHWIYCDANGAPDDVLASLDYYMGLAVNDHDDVAYMIREYGYCLPDVLRADTDADVIDYADPIGYRETDQENQS